MKHSLLVACAFVLAACSPTALAAPPSGTTPAPGPTSVASPGAPPGPLSETDLKYLLLAHYPDFFYCDPDFYPIARATDPVQLARQRLPDIQADPELFQSILRHNNLAGLTTFTDDQVVLIYADYKKLNAIPMEAADGGYSFEITTSSGKAAGQRIAGSIDSAGNITVQSQTPTVATCPICLSAQARIDTPGGAVLVTDLKVGDLVWTLNASGQRVAAPLVQVGSTPVPPTHEVVHLVLSDGRELWASPGHPTMDGRRLGDLRLGDVVDGARVTTAELVPYGQPETYDILPAGATGYYWANGILLASTLKEP